MIRRLNLFGSRWRPCMLTKPTGSSTGDPWVNSCYALSPWFGQFRYYGSLHSMEIHQLSVTVLSKHSTSRFGVSQTLGILVSILHHHCLHHKLPGSINSWPTSNQVCSLRIWHTLTDYCHLQITLALWYMLFLACIFVELFLNKECTYLDDFWF